MLIDYLLNALYWFIDFIFSLVPEGPDLPATLTETSNTLFTKAISLNNILPVQELFVVIGIYFAFEIAMIVLNALLWVIKVIRGHG